MPHQWRASPLNFAPSLFRSTDSDVLTVECQPELIHSTRWRSDNDKTLSVNVKHHAQRTARHRPFAHRNTARLHIGQCRIRLRSSA